MFGRKNGKMKPPANHAYVMARGREVGNLKPVKKVVKQPQQKGRPGY